MGVKIEYDKNMNVDYKLIAGNMLVQMYNSKSTIETFAKLLEEFGEQIRLEFNVSGNSD